MDMLASKTSFSIPFIFYRIIIKVTRPFQKKMKKLYYFVQKKDQKVFLYYLSKSRNIWSNLIHHIQLTDLLPKVRSGILYIFKCGPTVWWFSCFSSPQLRLLIIWCQITHSIVDPWPLVNHPAFASVMVRTRGSLVFLQISTAWFPSQPGPTRKPILPLDFLSISFSVR